MPESLPRTTPRRRRSLPILSWAAFLSCAAACGHGSSHGGSAPKPNGGGHVRATVSGAPANRSDAAALRLRVGGDGVQAYRHKFGLADATSCADAAGYGEERPVAADLTLDQSALADGAVVLCVVGRAGGQWQAFGEATRVSWALDRAGPADFTLLGAQAPGSPDQPYTFPWSAPLDAAPLTYTLAVARAEDGCDKPVHTVEAHPGIPASLVAALAPGRYVACLTATDGAGQVRVARQSGKITFDTPPDVHMVFFGGASPETKRLRYAHRAGPAVAWDQADLPSPGDDSRYADGASLQLGADGAPHAAYLALIPDELGQREARVTALDRQKDGTWASRALAAIAPGNGIVRASPLAWEGTAGPRLLVSAPGNADNQLLALDGTKPGLAAMQAVASTAPDSAIQDAALAVDDAGTLHVAYAADGRLHYRAAEGPAQTWGEDQVVSDRACVRADFAALAVARVPQAPQADVAIAYACTTGAGNGAACDLRLARRAADGSWGNVRVDALDPQGACLPFASARPALALGGDGRAHVAYRFAEAGRGAVYDVAVAVVTGDAVAHRQAFGDWGARVGFVKLALDASGRVHAGYVANDGIRLAWGPPGVAFTREVAVPAGAGDVIELADVALGGGPGRSLRPRAP